jgi:hypothetical protein
LDILDLKRGRLLFFSVLPVAMKLVGDIRREMGRREVGFRYFINLELGRDRHFRLRAGYESVSSPANAL